MSAWWLMLIVPLALSAGFGAGAAWSAFWRGLRDDE